MTYRKLLPAIVLASLAVAGSARAYGQIQIEPEAYRVRVLNEMPRRVCVKIIPFRQSTYFHADLDPREWTVRDLYAGQRVLCVWDDRTGDLLIAAGLNVNRSGVLRIRPITYVVPPTAAAVPRAEPRESPAMPPPSLEIEPEKK